MREDKINQLLKEADCVPEAPDCRGKVMERIRASRPVRSFMWAYAVAAMLILVVGGGILFRGANRAARIADDTNRPISDNIITLRNPGRPAKHKQPVKPKQKPTAS